MNTHAPARRRAGAASTPDEQAQETAADKRLYVEIGLAPVTCSHCGTQVLVKKNSDRHTSVQWTSDPASSCPEFAAAVVAGTLSAQFLGCPRLKASIEDAAVSGRLVVPDA
ncbi:MAG: hypothetical protein ABI232_13015 [Jatrophihabitantaceae bacterium]